MQVLEIVEGLFLWGRLFLLRQGTRVRSWQHRNVRVEWLLASRFLLWFGHVGCVLLYTVLQVGFRKLLHARIKLFDTSGLLSEFVAVVFLNFTADFLCSHLFLFRGLPFFGAQV
jgi:tryptophan-rich sensory protein